MATQNSVYIKCFWLLLEPRVRPYAGAQYEIYKIDDTGITINNLPQMLEEKTPLASVYVQQFKAPTFSSLTTDVQSKVGTGTFAAKLSGFFYPPISGEYFISMNEPIF